MKKIIIAGFIILLAAALFLANQLYLITAYNEGELVSLKPILGENEELVYQYTHSVEKGPVREYFKITSGSLIFYKTTFTSQGAGLPLDRGNFTKENGVFVRKGMEDEFAYINFRLSQVYEQQIIEIADTEIKMSDWGEPGQRIRLEVKSLPSILNIF